MINWMWKRGKFILGSLPSWWNFVTIEKTPCGNLEFTSDKSHHSRLDMINWMWKRGKSILGCLFSWWNLLTHRKNSMGKHRMYG